MQNFLLPPCHWLSSHVATTIEDAAMANGSAPPGESAGSTAASGCVEISVEPGKATTSSFGWGWVNKVGWPKVD